MNQITRKDVRNAFFNRTLAYIAIFDGKPIVTSHTEEDALNEAFETLINVGIDCDLTDIQVVAYSDLN